MKFLIPPFVLACVFVGWILGVEEEAKGIIVQPGEQVIFSNKEVKKFHNIHGVLYSRWDEKTSMWVFQNKKGKWCDLSVLPEAYIRHKKKGRGGG